MITNTYMYHIFLSLHCVEYHLMIRLANYLVNLMKQKYMHKSKPHLKPFTLTLNPIP